MKTLLRFKQFQSLKYISGGDFSPPLYFGTLIYFVLTLLSCSLLKAQNEFYELPPISYSKTQETNKVTQLAKLIKSGTSPFQSTQGNALLREVLHYFEISEESQVLVFSKTSKQIELISPRTPRAIYFNDHVYIGYTLGGQIEITYIDANLGPIFYIVKPDIDFGLTIKRDNSCLSCHGGSRSNGVPGIMIRSVIPDVRGHPIAGKADYNTVTSSPIKERWGGWYVTGHHGNLTHLGNYHETQATSIERFNIDDLSDFFTTSRYLQPSSDILALMLLEHQCHIQNIFTKASMKYKRALWMHKALSSLRSNNAIKKKETEPSSLDKLITREANTIVAALLFKDEFLFRDESIEGSEAFQNSFETAAIRDSKGRSLRDLKLYTRLFKHRCSYMIYSPAFNYLPSPIKQEVTRILKDNLERGAKNALHIKEKERLRILNILEETFFNQKEF